MKQLVLSFIALLSAFAIHAQDFQGMAVYESKTSLGDKMPKLDSKEITPEMRKMIEDGMKAMFEKTFVLNFDKTASIYVEEEKLDAGDEMTRGFKMMGSMMGSGGKQYKNIKDKTILQEKDLFGKEFLVSDTLPQIKWKMEGETKKIGTYTCYKATAVMPTDKSNLMNYRPKKDAEEKIKKDEEQQKSTNFMDVVDMPEDKIITAWYTPEVPVSQGPENYYGLPGLILEVTDGVTTILCSKVVLNPKEKAEIKPLKKGEKVTQAEYAEIMMKKMKEMQDMYGPKGGGNKTIRIGG